MPPSDCSSSTCSRASPSATEGVRARLDERRGRSRFYIAERQLRSGQRFDGVVMLKPGIYHLWCSLPGHWKLGMHATLRVVR